MKPIDRFCKTALQYTHWCSSPPENAAEEAQTALQLLQTLQQQAEWLRLPTDFDETLGGKRPDQEAWLAVYQRAAALPFQYYQELVDSKKSGKRGRAQASKRSKAKAPAATSSGEKEFSGDLSDDVADVFRDLSEGLSLYTKGHLAEAEWSLRFSYDSHWGKHAREACKVLVSWLASNQARP